jgi:hypothetical protein
MPVLNLYIFLRRRWLGCGPDWTASLQAEILTWRMQKVRESQWGAKVGRWYVVGGRWGRAGSRGAGQTKIQESEVRSQESE